MGEIRIDKLLLAEIEKKEAKDAKLDYEGKLLAIEVAQEIGASDEDIEKAFDVKIRPEHRKTLT